MTPSRTRLIRRLLKAGLIFLAFNVHMVLLWNYSPIRRRVTIDGEPQPYPFQVVVVTRTGAELFLSVEELETFLRKHSDYSFLLPPGREKVVEAQIVSSYQEKYGRYGGKGYPYLSVQPVDSNHQLIEVFMSGDPHDVVFGYEASEKKIVAKYWMVFGVGHLFLMIFMAVVLIRLEYLTLSLLARLAVLSCQLPVIEP